METNNPAADAGTQPANGEGGSTTPDAAKEEKPIGSFGDKPVVASAKGDGPCVSFKFKLTIKNGATLFGGPKVAGAEFGAGDNKDVTVEVEGDAVLNGAAADLFGGGDTGGPKIGSQDRGGRGAGQGQAYAARAVDAAESSGA